MSCCQPIIRKSSLRLAAHDGAGIAGPYSGVSATAKTFTRMTASAKSSASRARASDDAPHPPQAPRAINFGIIYGISAFGLGAAALGIGECARPAPYIAQYFERFPEMRVLIWTDTKEYRARSTAMSSHYSAGRKCHVPGIGNKIATPPAAPSPNAQGHQRAACRASAADIIKRAMIRVDRALARSGSPARMLLSVHDELVFEFRRMGRRRRPSSLPPRWRPRPAWACRWSRRRAGAKAGRTRIDRYCGGSRADRRRLPTLRKAAATPASAATSNRSTTRSPC